MSLNLSITQPTRANPLGIAVAVPVTVGVSTNDENFYDYTVESVTGSSTYNNWLVSVPFGVTLENKTSEIANLGSNGLVERITDGRSEIWCRLGSSYTPLKLSVSQYGGATVKIATGFVTDSVADIISTPVYAMMDAGGDLQMFSTKNHATASYVRNTASWVHGVEFTGIAVALATSGSNWNQENSPVLITPRHAVIVRHFATCTKNVSKARYLGNDGILYERTIIGISEFFITGSLTDDLIVVTFNAALPASVVPFSLAGEWLRQDVVDTNLERQFPGEFFAGGLGITVNQNFEALAVEFGNGINMSASAVLRNITYNGVSIPTIIGSMTLRSGAFLNSSILFDGYESFLEDIIPGDSGKPSFVINGSQALLVMNFTYSNLGPFIGTQNGTVINALIVNADLDAGIPNVLTVTIVPNLAS